MTMTDTHEPTRRRLIGTLFAGNALSSTGYLGVATVAVLIAEEITGSTALSGLAATTSTLGVAAGAASLSFMSYRMGRRPTFTTGYILATIGCAIAVYSIIASSLAILLVGMVAVGFGRSVSQLARYAAGDLRTEAHRARAISLIVWASTIGAIFGPILIGPMSSLAVTAGFNEYVGPVTVGVVGFGLAAILMFVGLRPDPLSLAVDEDADTRSGKPSTISALMSKRSVQLSVAAIVTSQLVMVLVMVMTPIHIRDNAGGLATVGWVMMAHTLGMFAIAPLTGWLIDRYGSRKLIAAAIGVLVVACLIAATATTASTPILIVGLFLLGVGWNFGFVAGSTLLQEGLSVPDRLKMQGFADSSAWVSSAFAAGLSGVIVANSSYVILAMIGALLSLIPLVVYNRVRTA